MKYITKSDIFAKKSNQHGKVPTKPSGNQQIPMTVLALDTIDHLPITSKGNRWALSEICLHTSYVLTFPMKYNLVESVVQTYLSGILVHKSGSVAILSDNEREIKNKVLNEAHNQFGIKRLFPNPFHPRGN